MLAALFFVAILSLSSINAKRGTLAPDGYPWYRDGDYYVRYLPLPEPGSGTLPSTEETNAQETRQVPKVYEPLSVIVLPLPAEKSAPRDAVIAKILENANATNSSQEDKAKIITAQRKKIPPPPLHEIVVGGETDLRLIAPDGTVTMLAGMEGNSGYADGAGDEARFAGIEGVAHVEDENALYCTDYLNNRIRRVDLLSHLVTTVAGTGELGNLDHPKQALEATLSRPIGILYAQGTNEIFFSMKGHVIRKFTFRGSRKQRTSVKLVVGHYQTASFKDSNLGLDARLNGPRHMSWEGQDGLFAVFTDSGNNRIRTFTSDKFSVQTRACNGEMKSVDGDSLTASCYRPKGIVSFNPIGPQSGSDMTTFFTEPAIHTVRRLARGKITTIVGKANEKDMSSNYWAEMFGIDARLSVPTGLATRHDTEVLYILEKGRNLIRGVDLAPKVLLGEDADEEEVELTLEERRKRIREALLGSWHHVPKRDDLTLKPKIVEVPEKKEQGTGEEAIVEDL